MVVLGQMSWAGPGPAARCRPRSMLLCTQPPCQTDLPVVHTLLLAPAALAGAKHHLLQPGCCVPILLHRSRCSLGSLAHQLAHGLFLRLVGALLVDDGLELGHQLLHAQSRSIGIPTGVIGKPVERWQLFAGAVDCTRPSGPLAVLVFLGQDLGLTGVEFLEELVFKTPERRVAG